MPRYRGDLETEKLPPKKSIVPHPPPPTKKKCPLHFQEIVKKFLDSTHVTVQYNINRSTRICSHVSMLRMCPSLEQLNSSTVYKYLSIHFSIFELCIKRMSIKQKTLEIT